MRSSTQPLTSCTDSFPLPSLTRRHNSLSSQSSSTTEYNHHNNNEGMKCEDNNNTSNSTDTATTPPLLLDDERPTHSMGAPCIWQQQEEEETAVVGSTNSCDERHESTIIHNHNSNSNNTHSHNNAAVTTGSTLLQPTQVSFAGSALSLWCPTTPLLSPKQHLYIPLEADNQGGGSGGSSGDKGPSVLPLPATDSIWGHNYCSGSNSLFLCGTAAAANHHADASQRHAATLVSCVPSHSNGASPFLGDRRDTAQRDADRRVARALLQWTERYDAFAQRAAGNTYYGLPSEKQQGMSDCCKTALGGGSGNGGNMMNPDTAKKLRIASIENNRELQALWRVASTEHLIERALRLARSTSSPRIQTTLTALRFFMAITAGYQLNPEICCEQRTGGALSVYVRMCQQFVIRSGSNTGGTRQSQSPSPSIRSPFFAKGMMLDAAGLGASQVSNFSLGSSSSMRQHKVTSVHALSWLHELLRLTHKWMRELPEAALLVLPMLITTTTAPDEDDSSTTPSLLLSAAVKASEAHRCEPTLLELFLRHILQWVPQPQLSSEGGLSAYASFSSKSLKMAMREHERSAAALTEYVCILRRLLDSDAHFATEGSQLTASLPSSKSATGIAGSNNNNNNNNYRHKSTTSSSSALQMKLRLVRVLVRGGSAYSTMQQTATSLNSSINNHIINNNNNWFQSLLCIVTDTIYRVMQNTPNTKAMTTDSSHRRHQNSSRSPLALSRCRSGSTSSANSSSSVFTTTGGNSERAVHVGAKLHLKLIDEAMELLTSMLCTMVSCSASSCCTTDAGCFPQQQQQQQHTAADEIDLSDWLAFVNSIMNSRILEALVELLQNKRVVSISSSSRVVMVRWMCALLVHTPTVIANGSMNAMTSSGGGGEGAAAMHFSTYPQNCLWCTRGLWPLLGALLTEGSAAAELVLGVSYAAGGGSAENTSKPFVSSSASRTAKQEHWSPLHYVSHHVAPPSPSAAATASRGNRWTSGAAMGSMSASGSSLEEVAEARANTRIPSLCCEELGAVDVLQCHRCALECYVCAVAATQHITGQLGSLAPASRQQEGNECNNSSDSNQATPSSSPSTLASMARKKWIERQIKRCGALAAIAQMLQNISGPFSSYGEVYSRGRTDAEGSKLEISLLPDRHSDTPPSANAITSHVALESSFNSSCHIPSAREAHETVTRQDAALLRQLLAAERAGVSVLLHCFQHMPHARRALLDNSACDTGALLIHYTSHLCGAYLSETLHEEFIGALEDALRALSLLCREDAEVSPQDRVVVGCKTTVQLIVDAGLVPELAKLISRPLWSCRHIPLAALDTLEEVLTSPRLSSRCRLRIVTESRFLVPSLVSTITGKDWEVLMEQWMSINSTGVAGPRDVQHTTCCPRGIPHALQAYVLIQRSLQVGALRLLRRWLTSPVVVKRLGCDEDDGVLDFSVTSPVRTSSSMTLMQQQVDLQRRSGATTSVFTGLSPSNEQHASASCSSRGGQRWDYVTPLLDSPHLINFLVATLKREHVDHMFPSSSTGRCASAAPEGAPAGRSSSTAATLSGRGGGGSSSSNINNNNNNGTGTSRPMYEHYNNPSSRVYPQRFHAYAYRASPPHSGASNVIDARPTPSPIPSGGGSSGTEAASSQPQSQVCRHEDERRQHQRRVLREVLQLIQAMPNAPSDGSTPTKERRFRDDNWSKLFVKVSKLFDALLARKVMQTCYSSSCSHEVNPHSAPVNIINHNNNINFNNNNNNHNNNTLELEEQALLLLTLQALMRFFPPFYLSGGLSAIANHRDPRQQLQCLSGITTSSLSTPLRVAVAASSSSSHDTRDTNRVHQYRLGEQGSTAYIRQLQELVVQHISFPVLDSLVSAWSSSSTAAAASSDGANNNNNTESRACTCPSSSAGSGAASCCAAEHDLLLGTLPMLWVLVRVAKDGSTTAV